MAKAILKVIYPPHVYMSHELRIVTVAERKNGSKDGWGKGSSSGSLGKSKRDDDGM